MKLYLIVLREDEKDDQGERPTNTDFVTKLFPRAHTFVQDSAWIVASDLPTNHAVLEELKVQSGGDRSDWSGIVVTLSQTGYYGYADKSLWETLRAWRADGEKS